jgi:hypothetical protein
MKRKRKSLRKLNEYGGIIERSQIAVKEVLFQSPGDP